MVNSFVFLLRQLWEIFKSHMSENKVLVHGKIRSVLNSIGLFPTHSQSKYMFVTMFSALPNYSFIIAPVRVYIIIIILLLLLLLWLV